MFSPWYAWSGRRAPEDHVCINVTTCGPGGRFTMTDRGAAALRQTPHSLTVGPSGLRWTGSELVITLNEVSSLPLISRVRGTIRLQPAAITGVELALKSDGRHVWRPFAPVARIAVDLEAKGWQWQGHGYFDANFGTRPLEEDFRFWTWGRFPTRDGAVCHYDATRRDGSTLAVGLRFDGNGGVRPAPLPPMAPLRRTLWGIPRHVRADAGTAPRSMLTMLDAPFYNRSIVATTLGGEALRGVHESLDLDRFAAPLVKPMLAFRVPRRRGWSFAKDA